MAEATKKRGPTAAQQRSVVRSLNQNVAAELIDKPAVWLRDNVNLAARNEDGSYDAPQLVANLLKATPAAELDDAMLEAVKQLVENIHPRNDRFDLGLAVLEAVFRQHGDLGLAAVGAELLRHLRECNRVDPRRPLELPSEAEYVERFEVEARERYAAMRSGWENRQAGRELYVCEKCGRYRFGREWKTGELPRGYEEHPASPDCPRCSNRGERI